ncbi:MAG: type II toxin-antitoxin system HicB family antitoxin [Armatimonadota bacterium]
MRDLFVEAHEDEVDGGYVASAIGYGIHTQAETLEELRANILDAVDCYFGDMQDHLPTVQLRVI